MQEVVTLVLRNLASEIPALTSAMGDVLAEAAAVCLEDRGHAEPVQLNLRKIQDPQFQLSRPSVTEAMRRTHNDLERASCSRFLGQMAVAHIIYNFFSRRRFRCQQVSVDWLAFRSDDRRRFSAP